MVVADSSVWIEHFHNPQAQLPRLIDGGVLRIHPLIIGELALGSIPDRTNLLAFLKSLPGHDQAAPEAMLEFIALHALHSKGIGLVDAHLLLSCATSADQLWTRDKHLSAQAERLGLAYQP